MLLRASDIAVRIGGVTLLEAVDLSFSAGELAVIVGPNGAGKSTLLAALSGDLRPSAGSITLSERALRGYTPRELALRRAVLPQSSNLQFHFTVEEVVALGAEAGRAASGSDDAAGAVETALRDADLTAFRGRFLPTLSGGERQRAHLARCLVQLRMSPIPGPKVLMLDEPTASLDPVHQHRIMGLAGRLAEQGHAVIAVLHDLNIAAAYGARLIMLRAGRVLFDGPMRQGLTRDGLATAFDLDADVTEHPGTGRPLVIQHGALNLPATGDLAGR